MFDFLSQKFSGILSKITGSGVLSEKNIDKPLHEVKEALLEADVPYDVVETFVESVKKACLGQKIFASLKPAEQFLKVVHEQLVQFLGGKQPESFTFQLPSVVMVMGLQGAGKTTSIAKLAHYVKKQAEQRGKQRRILFASVDFYRPAAVDQLEQLAHKIGVQFYRSAQTDVLKAARDIYQHYKQNSFELLFLDTAGRLHIDNALLEELRQINHELDPRYKLLVLDAMTGQESLTVARTFESVVGFDGCFLTKFDSETRGGAAFAFRYVLKKPILFVGTGEKADEYDLFHPERAAGRLLGMGDLQSLLERAQEKIKQADQENAYNAIKTGKLSLQDFALQMDMLNKFGSLHQLVKYLPQMGGGNLDQGTIDRGQVEIKRFRAIINSMTMKERLQPHILDASRKQRIAKGSGVQVSDINVLLDRFEQAQRYTKLFKKMGSFKQMFR